MNAARKKLLHQCKVLHDNALYTAEAHHNISADKQNEAKWLQVIPAMVTAVLVTIFGFGGVTVPDWVTPLVIFSAIISAVGGILDPKSSYYSHLNAAKLFTQIKNEAQALQDTLGPSLSDKELLLSVQKLQEKYATIIYATPATDNKSFEQAQKRIKQGVHKVDL